MQPTEIILKRFEEISSIPRGTKHEAGIRQWLVDRAHKNNFTSRVDATGNLAVYVPASTGRESAPILILQGHLDMVWQKTPDSNHDFKRDPIRLVREGDWIKADRTTLGADNGIAIAIMLTLAEDETAIHPPLELLFTVEEEQGLVGAHKLDPGLVSGKTLVNLDSEEEGVFTIGCAGGGSTYITMPVNWSALSAADIGLELKVGGLQGGHSGEDINKHRANANKIIARVLDLIQREVPIRLATLKGGSARNAIPRDAESVLVCAEENSTECREEFENIARVIQTEYGTTEPGISVTLSKAGTNPARAISFTESINAIRLLCSLPNGVAAMSPEIAGFVETSNNIGILELKEDGLAIVSNQRSSVPSRLEEMAYRVESLAGLAGAKTEQTRMSPPWRPNAVSPLLEKCKNIYESTFGMNPKIELSHSGLECGILSDRCGGLDTLSLGPTIQNPHSPSEQLYVPSVPRVWKFLTELLKSY